MRPNADSGEGWGATENRTSELHVACPAVQEGPQRTAFPWEREETDPRAGDVAKQRITLRALDTGRAEDYDSWRHALRAEVVASAPDTGRAMGYIAAIG